VRLTLLQRALAPSNPLMEGQGVQWPEEIGTWIQKPKEIKFLRPIRNDLISLSKAMNPVRKLMKTLAFINSFHFFESLKHRRAGHKPNTSSHKLGVYELDPWRLEEDLPVMILSHPNWWPIKI
jgi:hypothetical protein